MKLGYFHEAISAWRCVIVIGFPHPLLSIVCPELLGECIECNNVFYNFMLSRVQEFEILEPPCLAIETQGTPPLNDSISVTHYLKVSIPLALVFLIVLVYVEHFTGVAKFSRSNLIYSS